MRPYVIAELSGNHNGMIERAISLIDAAHRAGADAVKLQTYTADTLTIDCNKADFQITKGNWTGETLYSLYNKAHTPWEWHPRLFAHAKKLGIDIFSSPFDESAVEFLEQLHCSAYKIASFECLDLELIARAAATGKPLIISTGMATLDEVAQAIDTATQYGARGVLPMYCVSAYPAPYNEINLRSLPVLAQSTVGLVGLSDHTLGISVPVAAVALGAVAIEKHLTLSRADGGPDASFSLEPHEFSAMTESVRDAWAALGSADGGRKACESSSLVFRRSLYIVKNMKAGESFTRDKLRSIRPGFGMAPKFLPRVLGKVAAVDIERGTPLSTQLISNWELLQGTDHDD